MSLSNFRISQSLLFQPVAISIYLLFFAVGLVAALVLPSFSWFLAKEIGVRPLLVGLPFAGIALASIAYNHWIGHWSDSLKDRRPLIVGFCVLGAISCLIFALSRNYWLVAITAIFLFSLSMVAFSQMLAYSLDYAEAQIPPERIPLFNAIVRAQIAFAWVAGPPAGFVIATHWGFDWSYSLAALLYLLVAVFLMRFLPLLTAKTDPHFSAEGIESTSVSPPQRVSDPLANRALILCVIGFSLLWGTNNAYLISLPIHLKDNLNIDAQWMGWVMGTTAALEVPFMLLAGHFAARIPLINLVRLAGVAGLLLYCGVYFASALWHFFALQFFNSIFIGILAGLGVSVIQALMPGRSGGASALYTNTTHIGNLLSSFMVGVVAEYFGYREVFLVNIIWVLVAIWAFSMIRVKQASS